MQISILGLGYVGCVSAACLARDGHQVIGVDVNPDKVDALNAGRSPIIEPGLAELIGEMVQAGRLLATTDTAEALAASDISFICVGTPSTEAGAIDLTFVRRVCEEIGVALRGNVSRHTVVFRSTMLPGSTEQVAIPMLQAASGKQAGRDFGVCYHPEFLREGSALRDFYDPPRTVVGSIDAASGDVLAGLYGHLTAPLVRCDVRTAEMVKYADNAFHALKVAFANEIGNLCKSFGIDSHMAMRIFTLDTKLNLSSVYLKPGYAFGGSCLPKDLRALTHRAVEMDLDSPLLRAIIRSNEHQKRVGYDMIRHAGSKKIGILGLSFKQDTDDLRESPAVELVETLVGKGYDVAVYDRNVSLSALVGSNRAYIDRELPHLSVLLRPTIDEVLEHADVLVVTNHDQDFQFVFERLRPGQKVIDFVRILPELSSAQELYEGICW